MSAAPKRGKYGYATAYASVLIVLMLAVVGLIRLLVGRRDLGRRLPMGSCPVADPPANVEFRDVTKRFATAAAVDRVTFAIAQGTLVTLLGPSGCGKTTTLRLIAGLETPNDGTILIGGEDVTRLPVARRDIAMVFQSYALFPHLNVLDNVAFGLRNIGQSVREARAAAAEALDLVGLHAYEARMTGQLSGGQQQRVAVARAIVLRPKVLLLDEPLSNLDARLRRQVRDDIRALQQRLSLTVVYVTHDQQEALAVSDEVIVMSAGRIAQMDAPEGLYDAPANRFVADFIGEANIVPATILDVSDGSAAIQLGRAVLHLASRGRLPGQVELACCDHPRSCSARRVIPTPCSTAQFSAARILATASSIWCAPNLATCTSSITGARLACHRLPMSVCASIAPAPRCYWPKVDPARPAFWPVFADSMPA